MNWNRAEEVNFPWKRASRNVMYLAKYRCQWMGGCSISHNCRVLGGTHLHSGGTLSHGRYFWTHLLCVWHCAAKVHGIHRRLRHSAWDSQSGWGNTHIRRIHSTVWKCREEVLCMEKSERSLDVQVSNDRLHYCFYGKDCWFPSSLFRILSSVLFQIMIL